MKISGVLFWNRINDLLDKEHKTIKDLSENSDTSYDVIITQRTRKSIPKLEQLLDMAKFLNTSVEFLATGESLLQPLTPEAQAVENDPDLRALVRAVQRDRTLLSAISAVVKSYEKESKIG